MSPSLLEIVMILMVLPDSGWTGGLNSPTSRKPSAVCLTAGCVTAAGAILSAMDTSIDPCDDFYQYACGGFELRQSIPFGENKLDQFIIAENIVKKRLRALLEDKTWPPPHAHSTAHQKLRKFYKSCMNAEKLQQSSVPRMQKVAAKIGGLVVSESVAAPPPYSLNRILAAFNFYGENGLFLTKVDPDEKNVSSYIIHLEQHGLGLGRFSHKYYLNNVVTTDPVLVAYADMLEIFAKLIVGEERPVDRSFILDVIRFEQKLAEIQQTQTELQDHSMAYNKVSINWLQTNVGFLNWTRYFNSLLKPANISVQDNELVVLNCLPYFRNLTALLANYTKTSKGRQIIQNYLIFLILGRYAPYLGGQFQAADDAFATVIHGKAGAKERWRICLEDIDENIGFPLGAQYVEKYFPAERKNYAYQMFAALAKTFRERIFSATWMDEFTRKSVLEKLDAIALNIGYPGWLFNDTYLDRRYETLAVTEDYNVNQLAAFAFLRKTMFSNLRKPRDRTDWRITPQSANAYFTPAENKVIISAGMLNSPFYYSDEGIPTALNFGAIGGIAAHEITHGFDTMGRQFDKFGSLQNWWSAASSEAFTNRTQCMIKKYDAYQLNGMQISGRQTLPENIADNGGVRVAFQAYKSLSASKVTVRRRLVGVKLTGDQLFFLGWAQTWCTLYTPESLRFQVDAMPHSPFQFRVNGPLSSSEEFSKTFNCHINSRMNAKDKCSVW